MVSNVSVFANYSADNVGCLLRLASPTPWLPSGYLWCRRPERDKFGLEGFDLEGAKSMRTDRAGRAFEDLSFPAHVRIVSFLPTPLSGNITKRGGFGYACMRVLGPNDGMALLADELIPTGTPFLAVGVDHFLEDADRDLWTAAMFRVLMKSLKPELAIRCPESIATRRVH